MRSSSTGPLPESDPGRALGHGLTNTQSTQKHNPPPLLKPPLPLHGWVISRWILELPPMAIRLSGNCWFQVSGLKWLPLPFLPPLLQSSLPLLLPASCLYQLIFHAGERPALQAPQMPSHSMSLKDNTLDLFTCCHSESIHILYGGSALLMGRCRLHVVSYFLPQNVLRCVLHVYIQFYIFKSQWHELSVVGFMTG